MSTTDVQDWLPGCHAPRLNRLIRWRLGKHAPAPETTFEEFFRTGIFMLLEEVERLYSSGVAGKIWSPSGDYAQFETAGDYRQYRARGTAKVVLRIEVASTRAARGFVSEARVWCADRRTQLIFRPFWALVSPLARRVYSEGLAAAVRRAEAP